MIMVIIIKSCDTDKDDENGDGFDDYSDDYKDMIICSLNFSKSIHRNSGCLELVLWENTDD